MEPDHVGRINSSAPLPSSSQPIGLEGLANAAEQLPPTLNDREWQIQDDYEWCLHDAEVRRAYGGKVVVAYHRRIWGAGHNHLAAWEEAHRQAPELCKENIAVVVVPLDWNEANEGG